MILPLEKGVYTTACILGMFYCILIFLSMCSVEWEKKCFRSYFLLKRLCYTSQVDFQRSCSTLLKLPVETKESITFTNLIPLSYAYAIWGTSFAANGFTAVSVSSWLKYEQNQIYRIFELVCD